MSPPAVLEEVPPLAGIGLDVCPAAVCVAASSYSIDFTCAIGIVCFALSSPVKLISDAELAVTVPVIVEPSRIKIVACCPEPICVPHDASMKDARSTKLPIVTPRRIRPMRFAPCVRSPQGLRLEPLIFSRFTVTSTSLCFFVGAGSQFKSYSKNRCVAPAFGVRQPCSRFCNAAHVTIRLRRSPSSAQDSSSASACVLFQVDVIRRSREA